MDLIQSLWCCHMFLQSCILFILCLRLTSKHIQIQVSNKNTLFAAETAAAVITKRQNSHKRFHYKWCVFFFNGGARKWMVQNFRMEFPLEINDLGYPYDLGHPQTVSRYFNYPSTSFDVFLANLLRLLRRGHSLVATACSYAQGWWSQTPSELMWLDMISP